MNCRECQKIIFTTRADERTATEQERVAAHTLKCEECTRFTREADDMGRLLAAVAQEPAPVDFTQAVMKQVQAEKAPLSAPWYEALFGVLRAPAPAFSVRQAVAVAALALMLISVGMLATSQRPGQPGATPPATVTIAESGDPATGPAVVEVDGELVDELVRRHEFADALQPMSEDEGMRLIRY